MSPLWEDTLMAYLFDGSYAEHVEAHAARRPAFAAELEEQVVSAWRGHRCDSTMPKVSTTAMRWWNQRQRQPQG